MRVRQRGRRSNRAGEERTRSEGRRGLLHGAGRRGANAQLGRGSGRRERRAAGHQPAGHRRNHARRDGDVHLHLRHHRLAQGGGALQSPLLGQRPFGRARRVPLRGARPHLHLPAALPRHRVVGRRGRRVRQRRLDVRAPAVFGAGVPARSPRARVYVLHLRWRTVPLPARFARQAGRCGFALGHRDGQRPAAGRVDGFQDALRPQTHHRVLRRQRRQRGVRQSAEQRPHHRHDVVQGGVGALRRGRGRSRARQRGAVRRSGARGTRLAAGAHQSASGVRGLHRRSRHQEEDPARRVGGGRCVVQHRRSRARSGRGVLPRLSALPVR